MPCPLDIGPSSWYVESLTRRRRDARLHEGPARKVLPGAGASKSPGGTGPGLQRNQSEVRPARPDQETLLQLADMENELREETSLTSFIAGYQLGMGIAGEMERYCFEDEEEKRATERAKTGHPHVKD